jgi:hypothetical protein
MKAIAPYLLLLQALLWFEGSELQISSGLDSATKLLDSQDVRDRAWGAYIAGQNELTELEPNLPDHCLRCDPGMSYRSSLLHQEISIEFCQGHIFPVGNSIESPASSETPVP